MGKNYYPTLFHTGEAVSGILCPVWGSPVKREIEKLERALQRVTKAIRSLKHVAWKERFRELGLFGLEKALKELIATYECLKGGYKHNGDKFFSIDAENKSGRRCALRGLNWTFRKAFVLQGYMILTPNTQR